ncbi:MAG: 50S ribosomal protein L29 [Patescibacteria group bacterium]|nr:50S ribosomal protein L29 [Patescibacteria group bacterium]
MKSKDLRKKSTKELQNSLLESQTKLAALAIEYRTKEVKNVKQISAIKKDIARILTVQRELELEGEAK